jgi:hypothetical protein
MGARILASMHWAMKNGEVPWQIELQKLEHVATTPLKNTIGE